ncbi:methylated-DNA--[protein]-cysteine S-methyltransferase [Streptococcus castoreus]|uniref:methylated-DNA--[protein]-cysteine S-methyltransferase n=1 Tax=Streptococcus castoreus TaxID=254786 RepID=UPI00040A1454|nr:methylated-DNA--[protein]-cysteine S-methyltransferase [Streptococcus castoreus]
MVLYECHYQTPIGELSLVATDQALVGAWFLGQVHFQMGLKEVPLQGFNPILHQAKAWLDTYFNGEMQTIPIEIQPQGTLFQKSVWKALLAIPYGETVTYGQIAGQLNCKSAQAVGGAIGRNPISLFIPCHRVLAADGQLRGYAGGLDKKAWLLNHETILILKE